jgi:hypothetical protein
MEHLKWKKVATNGSDMAALGSYVFALQRASPVWEGVLFDTSTGVQTEITPPADCSDPVPYASLGAGHILLLCGIPPYTTALALYSLALGRWQVLGYSQAQFCGDDPECAVVPGDRGTDWQEYSLYGGRPGQYGGEGFQNLSTGAWKVTDPFAETMPGINATTMIDLDSPTLVVSVCTPIRLPNNGELFNGHSPIHMLGRYALVFHQNVHAPRPYVQRCGDSHKRWLAPGMTAGLAASSRLLVWAASRRRIGGMFLRSERTFTARFPLSLDAVDRAVLEVTPQAVFMQRESGRPIWEAALPSRQ